MFFSRVVTYSVLSTTFLLAQPILCAPSKFQQRQASISALTSRDFPDPSIIQDYDGNWYAFATNSGGVNVQVALSISGANDGPWEILPNDLLPTPGPWSNGQNVWAPDVRKVNGGYVLYYTATDSSSTAQHCVGAATSNTILGPYTATSTTIACNVTAGGAIDPSGFEDSHGTLYIVYKVDGNSIGNGGSCGNTIAPIVPTPLMIQPLLSDGVTPNGDPVEILDRSDADGPLIEAPNVILVNGVYFLFFSSNCYSTTLYDVSYATATNVLGPYTKSSAPLMVTNNPYAITSPGGATATVDGTKLVFHANCGAGRCLYETGITISGTTATISSPVNQGLFSSHRESPQKTTNTKLGDVFNRLNHTFGLAL